MIPLLSATLAILSRSTVSHGSEQCNVMDFQQLTSRAVRIDICIDSGTLQNSTSVSMSPLDMRVRGHLRVIAKDDAMSPWIWADSNLDILGSTASKANSSSSAGPEIMHSLIRSLARVDEVREKSWNRSLFVKPSTFFSLSSRRQQNVDGMKRSSCQPVSEPYFNTKTSSLHGIGGRS